MTHSGYAYFDVSAGTSSDFVIDMTGMTPDEMAEAIENDEHVQNETTVSVCHQCARDIDDPQVGDLVSFSVNGKHYVKRNGRWVEDK